MNKTERPSFTCLCRINWPVCHWSTLPCQEAWQEAAACQSIRWLQSFVCQSQLLLVVWHSVQLFTLYPCYSLVMMPNEHIGHIHADPSSFILVTHELKNCFIWDLTVLRFRMHFNIAYLGTELKSHSFQHWTLDSSVHVPQGLLHILPGTYRGRGAQ